MENQPQNIIAIGRKRFPIEEIALVEPFELPAEQPPRFTSDKEFRARVVLIDRYNVLTEDTVEAFAEANKFPAARQCRDQPGRAVSGRDLRALGGFSAAQTLSVPSQMARSGRQGAIQAIADKTGNGDCRGLARRSGAGAGSPCPFLGPISRRNAVSTAGTPTRHRGKASKFASGSSKATNSL
jgi:hypothetical protein